MKKLLTILLFFSFTVGVMAQGAGIMERACFCGNAPTSAQIYALFGKPTETSSKKAYESISSTFWDWVWDDISHQAGEWRNANQAFDYMWRLGGNNYFPLTSGQLLSNIIGSLDPVVPLISYSHNQFSGVLASNNTSYGYRSKQWLYPVNTLQTGNTAIGENAATNFSMGIGNTFLGKNSGYSVSNGHNNTIIGRDLSSSSVSTKTGLTVIGANQAYTGVLNNSILLGTGDGTTHLNVQGGRFVIGNGIQAGNSAKVEIYSSSEAALKLADGTQGDGKILTSDANGVASWKTNNSTYTANAPLEITNNVIKMKAPNANNRYLYYYNTPTSTGYSWEPAPNAWIGQYLGISIIAAAGQIVFKTAFTVRTYADLYIVNNSMFVDIEYSDNQGLTWIPFTSGNLSLYTQYAGNVLQFRGIASPNAAPLERFVSIMIGNK